MQKNWMFIRYKQADKQTDKYIESDEKLNSYCFVEHNCKF